MIQLLLNKTTPHFQLLPMSKVDQSAFMGRRLYSKQKVKEYTISFVDSRLHTNSEIDKAVT